MPRRGQYKPVTPVKENTKKKRAYLHQKDTDKIKSKGSYLRKVRLPAQKVNATDFEADEPSLLSRKRLKLDNGPLNEFDVPTKENHSEEQRSSKASHSRDEETHSKRVQDEAPEQNHPSLHDEELTKIDGSTLNEPNVYDASIEQLSITSEDVSPPVDNFCDEAILESSACNVTEPSSDVIEFEIEYKDIGEHKSSLLDAGNTGADEESNEDSVVLASEVIENYADEPDNLSGDEDDGFPPDRGEKFGDHPLFENAPVSIDETLLLILTFARRHKLSNKAMDHLLKLIHLLLPDRNHFITSYDTVKRYFRTLDPSIKNIYYCKSCHETYEDETNECPECGQFIGSQDYFVALPVEKQLKNILEDSMEEIVKYKKERVQRKQNVNNIEDVMDGALYAERFTPDGFFKDSTPGDDQLHLSLQENTDGVSLFKSTKQSVWPVYFTINELPPNLRYTRRCRLFPVLWFDGKPVMDAMMKYIKDIIERLNRGIRFHNTKVRAILLSGVYDLPAKADVMNMMHYNGAYGCATCLEPGESTINLNGNKVHTYPFQEGTDNGFREKRNHTDTLATSLTGTSEKPVKGLKGNSDLGQCPGMDIIRGTAIDYMHGLPLGAILWLFKYWTLLQYKGQPWYVGHKMAVLDKRLNFIAPPSFINRWPTTFQDVTSWKAADCKNVFMYGILAIMKGILPPEYYSHASKLVQAMHILLSDSISVTSLTLARRLLIDFCREFPTLYHPSFELINFHNLLHLCEKVEDLGPLWTQSTFFYEDLNGDLRAMFNGTRSVHNQVLEAVSIQHQLPILAKNLQPGSAVAEMYSLMTNYHKINSPLTRIRPGLCAVGSFKPCNLPRNIQNRLEVMYGDNLEVDKFERIRLRNSIITSMSYRDSYIKRVSYTVCYRHGDVLKYGQVRYFLRILCGTAVNYVAIVRKLVSNDEVLGGYLLGVNFDRMDAIVPTGYLRELCFFIDNGENTYVARFPNSVEKE